MSKNDRICIFGARGMVGSGIIAELQSRGYCSVIGATRSDCDLTEQSEVRRFLEMVKPDTVVVAAAKVGGIYANATYPAEFCFQNLQIAANAIHESYKANVKKLLYLGSSCIYPRLAPQPIPETALLSGPLEPTNEAYAVAKIAGLKLCQFYRLQYGVHYMSAMPCNLYGPGDNYHPQNSHVLPALIRRFHEAKLDKKPCVDVWGTGTAMREFLYRDDMAKACCFLLENYRGEEIINIGSHEELSIAALAHKVAFIVGYEGDIRFDPSKPDGTPRKKVDTSRIEALGWKPETSLDEGIRRSYAEFLQLNVLRS